MGCKGRIYLQQEREEVKSLCILGTARSSGRLEQSLHLEALHEQNGWAEGELRWLWVC